MTRKRHNHRHRVVSYNASGRNKGKGGSSLIAAAAVIPAAVVQAATDDLGGPKTNKSAHFSRWLVMCIIVTIGIIAAIYASKGTATTTTPVHHSTATFRPETDTATRPVTRPHTRPSSAPYTAASDAPVLTAKRVTTVIMWFLVSLLIVQGAWTGYLVTATYVLKKGPIAESRELFGDEPVF